MTQPRRTPRTLLLSNRRYEHDVWRCGQVEFEDVIRDVDEVHLLAPRASQRTPGVALRQAERVTKHLLGLEFSYVPQLETIRLRGEYELVFVYVQGLGDLKVLDAVPDWRRRCSKAVCFIEEVWVRTLERWSQRTFDQLAQFDLITCVQHGSVARLGSLVGRRSEWLPGGVDALRFFPGLPAPPRTIDVFAMGRRSDISHRALLEHVARHGWTYLFDTVNQAGVRGGDHIQHRTQLAELVKRSRYFLANKSRIDRVDDTGGQEDLGFRSFEGAAGGAVLIGDTPRGAHVRAVFDWPDAHIDVPFDSTRMADVIAALDREPERIARIRRNNVVHTLRRHDWVYRWHRVLEMLDVPTLERLNHRTQRLAELATRTEQAVSEPREDRPLGSASSH